MEPGNDVTVLVDEALVGKILDNLLNNAMTYGDHPPTIRVGARREDQGRIFARFVRGSDPMVTEKPGTGLGLYLSYGLAEQMGGSPQVLSSQAGKGS